MFNESTSTSYTSRVFKKTFGPKQDRHFNESNEKKKFYLQLLQIRYSLDKRMERYSFV